MIKSTVSKYPSGPEILKFFYSSVKSIEPYMKNIGIPYRWCQIMCGMFYENRFNQQSYLYMAEEDETKQQTKSSHDKEAHLDSLVELEDDADKIEIDNDNLEQNEANHVNGIDCEINTTNCAIDLNDLNNQNESKLIIQILNRLKSRFKARIDLHQIINSLSKLILFKNCFFL